MAEFQIPVPLGATIEPNGDLTFLARGKAPKAPQGFKRVSDYHFTPILTPCKHRKVKYIFYERCKCTGETVHCALFDTINLSRCVNCKEEKQ